MRHRRNLDFARLGYVSNRTGRARFLAPVNAQRKCRSSRVYAAIEPEMSKSVAIGRSRVSGYVISKSTMKQSMVNRDCFLSYVV
jgi:hypothetical protein